jgi:ribose transport system substrate-binding protein
MKLRISILMSVFLVASMVMTACAPAATPAPVAPAAPAAPANTVAPAAPAAPANTVAPAASNAGKKFKVGYSAAGLIDVLQVTWSKAVCKSVTDAGGDCIVVDSQNKIDKQVADIEDLLTQKIDILVINPVDDKGIGVAIAEANKANVPVVTIDRNGGSGVIAAKVGSDNYYAGYQAGEYCAKIYNGKGEVAQLMGQAGGADVRDRGNGFRDAIAKYPGMKIVFEEHGDWDTAKSQTLTENLLTSNPNVECIWAHADAMIMGAVQALKAAGKLDKVTTIGMGMYAGGPEAIKAGELTASWYMYPELIGSTAGEVVVKIHNGDKYDSFTRTPLTFVTKDNIDGFLTKTVPTPPAETAVPIPPTKTP